MNNVQGLAESPLIVFGGFVSEANPPDIPAGSAVIATDCDFTVASVRTRDGLENVYTYRGSSETAAGISVENMSPGSVAWTSSSSNPQFNLLINATGTPGASFTATTNGQAVNVGDVMLVGVFTLNALASGADPITSITDSLGNTWLPLFNSMSFTRNVTQAATFQVYYSVAAHAVPSLSTFTVTVDLTFNPLQVLDICGGVWSGLSSLDQTTNSLFASTTGSDTIGPLTITHSAILLSFAAFDNGSGHLTSYPPVNYFGFMNPGTFPGETGSQWGGVYQTVTPGSYNAVWQVTSTALAASLSSFLLPGSGSWTVMVTPGQTSQFLNVQGFGFSIPAGATILGIQAVVNGSQSIAGQTLTATILGGNSKTFSLPLSTGTVTLGGSSDLWGDTWTPAEINNPAFGFSLQASSPSSSVTFTLTPTIVSATVWYTPPGLSQFDYVKTFEMTDGEVLTLALDNNGVFWQEDVDDTPGVLAPFYTAIEPNTFARSVTQDDREFIALSDLQMGTDMPRAYNGQWVDRLSQVGPGASPSFNATSNSFGIASITQPPAVVNAGTFAPFRAVLWSSGVGIKHTAGNIFSLYYSFHTSPPDPNVVVGNYVYLANFATTGGASPNGTYQIIDAGVIAGGPGGPCNYFSVQVPSSQNAYYQPGAGPSYNITMATITLDAPDATVQVGAQISIAGATPSTWDDTWTILAALNAAQLTVTATALSAGVATYNFTIISGTAPTVGQQVTITGTTNGSGIFNVTNGVINAASPSSFSLLIDSPDIAPAVEANGQAIVNGTTFQFDVGPKYAGTATNPILGNDTGTGTIVQAGQLGAGTRMGTVMFLTRNGFLTAPAPPATFTLNEGANSISATNIPIGPPNVIARVIAFTGANGAFFFWVPTPVIVTNSGQAITYSSTVIQDNVTTQATFNLTDAVLLAALSIDSQGANNFAEIELGSSIGVTSYASRIFAWGEQNKIQNLLNWSFDGGYLAANQQSNLVPLGWTVDQTNGAGGQLVVSPQFGNAYYIHNTTGSTQALYGMIWQSAFQDADQVPIITPQTQYSVRVTASSPSGAASGNLVIDLFSPSFGVVYGSFSLPLASLSSSMKIFTGTLLTTAFTTEVPDDLRLRIYASQIPNGADVELDRIEPFNTAEPTLTTQLRGSYFNNFEAFDGVTGNLGVGSQNQQPVRNTFSLFDNLYVVKTKSFYSTSDNGTTEPNFWNVREVSNKVGTPSIYGVDVGEGWALIAGQAGLYIFTGGDPQKISPELDGNPGVWQSISWKYGDTIWLRNDTNSRKIYVGVPIPTPNQWMPNFPVNANPTQPNVVLMCNYKELMTSGALANEAPIRLTYTGELKTYSLGRKWSAWSIEACYADFIKRQDTTEPLFFCGDTATGKIYQQITGNYSDDGAAMHCDYVTYPFPKTREAEELQMGLHQLLAHFMTILANGEGNLRMTIYPDSVNSPNQEALYPEVLADPPSEGDIEIPLNSEGNRFFVGLSVLDPGEWFEVSRIVMALGTNPWAPLRGQNS